MRLHSPAAERNREPILAVLKDVLPTREGALVLEIASGTGMHAAWLAPRLAGIVWQPTDVDAESLASIDAWRDHAGPNVRPAMRLDVRDASWPVERADAIFCANMIHIAPWECALALLDGARRVLGDGAPLVLYGPFARGGAHTAESNEAFDESLKRRDPSWGVRDLDVVLREAGERGFAVDRVVPMPANNLTVVLRRVDDTVG